MKKIILIFTLFLLFVGCDLFNASLDPDYWQKIDDEIVYANAPWVPVFIQTSGMGIADPTGPQPNLVKKAPLAGTSFMKYEFSLYFQPSRDYPFIGWQAWVEGEGIWAQWSQDEETGSNLVKFIPKNDDGTEVDIFVYEMPPDGKQLYIGPMGADTTGLKVYVETGDLGTAFPIGELPGIVQGYPFNISFQPDAAYPFRGWQAMIGDEVISHWNSGVPVTTTTGNVKWAPRNASGTEMSITITSNLSEQITIMPLGGDNNPAIVTVAVPEGWGSASPVGLLSNRRQGFPFAVEFTPSTARAFIGWRAYRNYDGPGNPSEQITNDDVVFTNIDGGRARVTVNTSEEVFLVPWCEPRPRIEQSDPPLLYTGVPYSSGKMVRIWFSSALDEDTVRFGEGFVEINGQNTNTGDRYENMQQHFEDPVYDNNSIIITPRSGSLPPVDQLITITVGTAVLAANGHGMFSPVQVMYRTGTQTIKNVYNADNVWAIHDPSQPSVTEESFFHQDAPAARDRRLRKNAEGNYEVTLYFRVSRSTDDIIEPEPNALNIAEVQYANLIGGEIGSLINERTVTLTPMEDTGAGLAYRQSNSSANPLGVSFWKAVYTWDTAPDSGIIRLVVLPLREGANSVAVDDWPSAQAEGRFVTVVLDDLHPGGSVTLAHDEGAASVTSDVYNYNSTTNNVFKLNADFSRIADNYTAAYTAGMGIQREAATRNNPWTMDEPSAIQWQYRIQGGAVTYHESDWLPLSSAQQSIDLTNTNRMSLPNTTDIRDVQIRYCDSLGNGVNGSWTTVRQIRYYSPTINPVTTWSAAYNESANTITVTWTKPAEMSGVELSVNGGAAQNITGAIASNTNHTHTITGVPRLNDLGIRSGQAVSNVAGYTISLTAYNDYGRQQEPTVARVWNIPGMNVSETNTILLTQDNFAGTMQAVGSSEQVAVSSYILTSNITVSGWMPVDLAGKAFYGNGHTVTINGLSGATEYMGLFGSVQDAEIRDLRVEYAGSTTVSRAGELYFGGIAGKAGGSSVIRNVIVGGNGGRVTVTNTNTANPANSLTSENSPTFAGIITGSMQPTVLIDNCYAGLELEVTASGYSGIRAGGITGFINDDETVANTKVMINRITMAGIVNAKSANETSTHNYIRIGGIVGESRGLGIIQNLEVSGGLEMSAISTVQNSEVIHSPTAGTVDSDKYLDYILGGIIGRMRDGQMLSCSFTGSISVPPSHSVERNTSIGGLAGTIGVVYDSVLILDHNKERVVLKDSNARGDILINLACPSKVLLGGVFGTIWGIDNDKRIVFDNCEYSDGEISFTRTVGNVHSHIGGFGAESVVNVELINCRSRAGLVKVDFLGTAVVTGSIGGFIAIFRGNVTGSYSHSPIKANIGGLSGGGDASIGGFIGLFQSSSAFPAPNDPGYWLINRCYASGSIDVTTSSTQNNNYVRVGGFVGQMEANARTEDCYATGDVSVDRSGGGHTVVGGFTGHLRVNSGNTPGASRCFSTGEVKGNSSSNSGDHYAVGGVFGDLSSGCKISNSVALGPFVTMRGNNASTNNIGRVVGVASNDAVTGAHAISTMKLNHSTEYNGTTTEFTGFTPGANTKHGENATTETTRDRSFWRNTLGFDDDDWLFTTVQTRGYPILRAPPVNYIPGPALGGQ